MNTLTITPYTQIPNVIQSRLDDFLTLCFSTKLPSLLLDDSCGIHVLLYNEHSIVGYLFTESFDREEIEFVGAIHPEHRNKGYFKYLLSFSYRYLKKYLPLKKSCYYSCYLSGEERNSIEIIRHFGGKTISTEFILTCTKENTTQPLEISLQPTTNIALLSHIHSQIFSQTKEESYTQLCESMDGTFFYLMFQQQVVGMVHISSSHSLHYLSFFGILPKYQRLGFGTSALDMIFSQYETIDLQVSSLNKKAYSFYRNYGFSIKSSYDYIILQKKVLEKLPCHC